MRIINLEAENYKRLVAVDITPNGAIVDIVGRNAQGKSSGSRMGREGLVGGCSMTEYVHLVGAEQVERAGSRMSGAAETFSSSVGWMSEALDRENTRRDEALGRLEALVERFEKAASTLAAAVELVS